MTIGKASRVAVLVAAACLSGTFLFAGEYDHPAAAEHPAETAEHPADTAAADASAGAESWQNETWSPEAPAASEPSGRTMAEFVDKLKGGNKRLFTDEEVMTLMTAARKVKETDRKLGMDVERIAAKMSQL